ncbi:sigma-70 family RNA polymerase sigma factor [Actinosynnema sp. NPDC050436]|uniref:sigma-70 family RNA polymerase sigma factor n=1 Tax=Actinosynnema sp. NPDC050436 TaxID=3155659 RepID=UPI0033E495C7
MNGDLRARVGQLQPFIRATVRRYCRLPLPAHLSHDDLVQDASLSVLTALPRYVGTPESMQGWVAVIVRRRVAEVYRTPATWLCRPVEDMTDLVHRLDRHRHAGTRPTDDEATTAGLLSHLDERSRLVVVLHCVLDLPHEEIARRTGSTPTAVRVAYNRALTRLRAMSGWGIGVPVVLIHRDTVRLHPRNLHRNLGELAALAASIQAHGLRRPLLVHRLPGRGGPVELLDGHRHLAAAARTTRTQMPAVVLTDVSRSWLDRAAHGLTPPQAQALLIEHTTTDRTAGS